PANSSFQHITKSPYSIGRLASFPLRVRQVESTRPTGPAPNSAIETDHSAVRHKLSESNDGTRGRRNLWTDDTFQVGRGIDLTIEIITRRQHTEAVPHFHSTNTWHFSCPRSSLVSECTTTIPRA